MATQVQNRRGTTAEHSTFTGAVGEVTIDTDKDTVVVHDGATAGGRPLLREDQSNLPTSAPTTGIYNASGSLAISTNGTGRLFVNANGEIGANATPITNYGAVLGPVSGQTISLLGLRSSSDTGTSRIDFGDPTSADVGRLIYQHAVNDFLLHVNGSERLRITSDGKVGIGTSSVSHRLHVAGSNGSGNTTIGCYGGTTAGDYGLITLGTGSTDKASINVDATNNDLRLDLRGNDGAFRFVSGASYTERMRLDSSGRLGIGTNTNINHTLQVYGSLCVDGFADPANNYITLRNNFIPGAGGAVGFKAVNNEGGNSDGLGCYGADGIAFFTGAGSERARIDSSGRLLVGTSSSFDSTAFIQATSTSGSQTAFAAKITTSNTASVFSCNNSSNSYVGGINVSSTATAFATSSDYRLKENVIAVTDGITRLQQLKPSRFNFIADPDTTVDGFLAHEVQTVVPEAIFGEKDAVNENGDPIYQSIDQAKLVPLLTAALQEAIGRIETLEAEVAALKAQ